MGLLDGQLSKAVYAGFKGKLLKGTLRRVSPAASGGLDGLGDPIATDAQTWGCQGFTEDYSDAFKVTAGIPMADLKANMFAASLPGVRPQKDDQVAFVRAGVTSWYQVRKAAIDPAGALWVCQAFAIPDPTL